MSKARLTVLANRLVTTVAAFVARTESVCILSASIFGAATAAAAPLPSSLAVDGTGGTRLRELSALQKARASVESGSDITSLSSTTPSRSWTPAAISAAVPPRAAAASGSASLFVRLSMYSASSARLISRSGEVLGAWTQTRSVGRKQASMQMRWCGEEKAKAWKKTERHWRSRT